jgi:hypothetical protein
MGPFPPPAPWFWWMNTPHPRESLWKGLDKATIEGFNRKSQEGLRQVYDGRFSIQIISIGNKYWGPLNRKKRGTLRGLRIYHSKTKKQILRKPLLKWYIIHSNDIFAVLTSVDTNDILYCINCCHYCAHHQPVLLYYHLATWSTDDTLCQCKYAIWVQNHE